MKIFLTILILCLVSAHAFAQTGWVPLHSGVGATLRAVAFVSDDTGYAAGDSAVLLRTSDGGATWIRIGLPPVVVARSSFSKIIFTSPLTGHVFGGVDTSLANQVGRSVILRTEDGGASWSVLVLDSLSVITDGSFPEPSVGFATGGGEML